MKTSSCKAKGRTLQKLVRDGLLKIGIPLGLETGDVVSTPMGVSGVDTQLSPSARKLFSMPSGELAIECKNVEALNVMATFREHAAKYPGKTPLLVHKKNGVEPIVAMYFSQLMALIEDYLHLRRKAA